MQRGLHKGLEECHSFLVSLRATLGNQHNVVFELRVRLDTWRLGLAKVDDEGLFCGKDGVGGHVFALLVKDLWCATSSRQHRSRSKANE